MINLAPHKEANEWFCSRLHRFWPQTDHYTTRPRIPITNVIIFRLIRTSISTGEIQTITRLVQTKLNDQHSERIQYARDPIHTKHPSGRLT